LDSINFISAIGNILSAIGGALLTVVIFFAKNALSQRTKIDETMLKERRELYKKLWEKTKLLPKWPQATDVTYAKLHTLSEELRNWYFEQGGIYLSEQARKVYGNVQENLCKTVQGKQNDQAKTITDAEYKNLVDFCSALRTELTRDLQSRKRAFWDV
jgi:Zn-dependent oligopeptidase